MLSSTSLLNYAYELNGDTGYSKNGQSLWCQYIWLLYHLSVMLSWLWFIILSALLITYAPE